MLFHEIQLVKEKQKAKETKNMISFITEKGKKQTNQKTTAYTIPTFTQTEKTHTHTLYHQSLLMLVELICTMCTSNPNNNTARWCSG